MIDRGKRCLAGSLSEALKPYRAEMARFAEAGRPRLFKALNELWAAVFPMVLPPDRDDGLGIILLDSNADTHFSFTNALGMISVEQVKGIEIAAAHYPRACWIIALHHHVIEYPKAAKVLSERIGTALVNGNWFVRRLQALGNRAVLMHGHRHIDWIGKCAELSIVSAPSPVMEATDDADTYFYIHTVATRDGGGLGLLAPERVVVGGAQPTDRRLATVGSQFVGPRRLPEARTLKACLRLGSGSRCDFRTGVRPAALPREAVVRQRLPWRGHRAISAPSTRPGMSSARRHRRL